MEIEQQIGLKAHVQKEMPLFLTLRDSDGKGLVTAMLPPGGADLSDTPFRCIVVGPGNADPYTAHGDAIEKLGEHFGLTLDREHCFPLSPRLEIRPWKIRYGARAARGSREPICAASWSRPRCAGAARFGDYEALHRWSIEQPQEFWPALWDFAGVIGERGDARARRRRQDAGRAVLPRRAAQLRREPAATARRRRRPRLLGRGQGAAPPEPAPSSTTRSRGCPGADGARRRSRATGSRAICPTCRRRSSRARHRRRSARCGRPARPISASRACSTASARSSPRCWSLADGYFYNGKASTSRQGARDRRRAAERRARRASRPIRGDRVAPDGIANAVTLDADFVAPFAARRDRASSVCRSTTRSTSSFPRARPACRNASSTAPAARCCSTSRSISSIATSSRATASSISPPAAG